MLFKLISSGNANRKRAADTSATGALPARKRPRYSISRAAAIWSFLQNRPDSRPFFTDDFRSLIQDGNSCIQIGDTDLDDISPNTNVVPIFSNIGTFRATVNALIREAKSGTLMDSSGATVSFSEVNLTGSGNRNPALRSKYYYNSDTHTLTKEFFNPTADLPTRISDHVFSLTLETAQTAEEIAAVLGCNSSTVSKLLKAMVDNGRIMDLSTDSHCYVYSSSLGSNLVRTSRPDNPITNGQLVAFLSAHPDKPFSSQDLVEYFRENGFPDCGIPQMSSWLNNLRRYKQHPCEVHCHDRSPKLYSYDSEKGVIVIDKDERPKSRVNVDILATLLPLVDYDTPMSTTHIQRLLKETSIHRSKISGLLRAAAIEDTDFKAAARGTFRYYISSEDQKLHLCNRAPATAAPPEPPREPRLANIDVVLAVIKNHSTKNFPLQVSEIAEHISDKNGRWVTSVFNNLRHRFGDHFTNDDNYDAKLRQQRAYYFHDGQFYRTSKVPLGLFLNLHEVRKLTV